MKSRLVVFLVFFPVSLWALEFVLRWAMHSEDSRTFLAPAIASAAVALIGPVAVPRYSGSWYGIRRDDTVSFLGLFGLVPGMVIWVACLAINIRKAVPDELAGVMGANAWQYTLAMALYLFAMVLTLMKEGT